MATENERDAHIEALAFFGRMAADVSHELRNRLATINEKDGLITDLLEFSRRGRPPDPERLMTLSADIKKHVGLAETTCADLSQFAYLADVARRDENIDELVSLVGRLLQRRGRNNGQEISTRTRGHISASVNPFQLAFAIFQILSWVIKAAPEGKLELSTLRMSERVGVEIAGADFSPMKGSMSPVLEWTLSQIPAHLEAGEGPRAIVIAIEESVA